MTITWYRVYRDQTELQLIGLFRRRYDERGQGVGEEAYHPRDGWRLTDYWLRTARGEPDRHLVEVAEDEACETVLHFDRLWADGDPRA